MLVYARAIPRHRNHTKGRPVAIVEGLNSADRQHRAPYSQTPLFFDDNRGTIIFSYKTYRALACGTPRSGKHKYPYTVVDVSGTVNDGQGIVRHRKVNVKVNLHGASFGVRIIQTGRGIYTLRVDIPRLPQYPQTFTGLQGVIDTRR